MSKSFITWGLGLAVFGILVPRSSYAADMTAAEMGVAGKPTPPSAADKKLMESAAKAAPKAIADHATMVTTNADGTMRTLREGTNGFTCMPDNVETPNPDPMCVDKAAMDWLGAYMAHKPPPEGRMGLAYMLAGGTDASNIDPYAKAPTGTNSWIQTGAHVMIVGADITFYNMYPKTAKPDTTGPYVMWPGTPYEHLMIPTTP